MSEWILKIFKLYGYTKRKKSLYCNSYFIEYDGYNKSLKFLKSHLYWQLCKITAPLQEQEISKTFKLERLDDIQGG